VVAPPTTFLHFILLPNFSGCWRISSSAELLVVGRKEGCTDPFLLLLLSLDLLLTPGRTGVRSPIHSAQGGFLADSLWRKMWIHNLLIVLLLHYAALLSLELIFTRKALIISWIVQLYCILFFMSKALIFKM
jgi:hypothetical protein